MLSYRSRLQSLGISQLEIAKMLKCEPSTLNRYLMGNRRMPREFRAWLDALLWRLEGTQEGSK